MTHTVSRLAFLMDALDITGSNLAKAIHIDNSQVSRWKNILRPLSPNSTHLKNIAEYFFSVERSHGVHFLTNLLLEYDPDLDTGSRGDLVNCLCRWLTDPAPLKHSQSGSIASRNISGHNCLFRVFRGNEGRRLAVLEFLDYVLTLPEGQQLLLVSQEDLSWLVEDPSFLSVWKQKLTEVLHKKHKIKIIHWVDRQIENLATVVTQWLPLHLTGKIESWYYPIYAENLFKISLFIVEEAIAATGMTSEKPAQDRYTALYNDSATVGQCEWIFNTLLRECKPLIETHPIGRMYDLFNKVSAREGKKPQSYFYSDMPLYLAASRDILTGILAANDMNTATAKRCLRHNKLMNTVLYNSHSVNRHIYNLDQLKHAAEMDTMNEHILSTVAGTVISVSKDIFSEYILYLLHQLQTINTFEIALISFRDAPFRISAPLWVEQDNSVIAWSKDSQFPFAISADEPTIVNTFYYVYNKMWQAIPQIYRDKEWVMRELQQLIT